MVVVVIGVAVVVVVGGRGVAHVEALLDRVLAFVDRRVEALFLDLFLVTRQQTHTHAHTPYHICCLIELN